MKKIINGKMYNTETATCVGTYSNGYHRGDFNYVEESLYLKKTGEFFFYGHGGANSKYTEQTGTSTWSGGEVIKPFTHNEAREWAEKMLDGDEYEAVFGKIIEDEERSVYSLSLQKDKLEKLKRLSSQMGVSVGKLADELIEEAWERHTNPSRITPDVIKQLTDKAKEEVSRNKDECDLEIVYIPAVATYSKDGSIGKVTNCTSELMRIYNKTRGKSSNFR